jgi:hypothetical protein
VVPVNPLAQPGPDADPETVKLFKAFVSDGRITSMPAKWNRKLRLLEHVSQLFEPGIRYGELEVNRILMPVYDDYIALRRYLVEAGFLDRENGQYWRSGGPVDV